MPRRITRTAIDSAPSTVTIMRSHIKTTTIARRRRRAPTPKEDQPVRPALLRSLVSHRGARRARRGARRACPDRPDPHRPAAAAHRAARLARQGHAGRVHAVLGAGEVHRRRAQGRGRRRRHHLQSRPGAQPGAPPRPAGEGALPRRPALRARRPGGVAGEQGDRHPARHGPRRRGHRDEVGPRADRRAHQHLGEPDRPPLGRVPLPGTRLAQRDVHRPGLHLRPRGDARRGQDLHRARRQGREDHLEPGRHQGLRRDDRRHPRRLRRRLGGRRRRRPRAALRGVVQLRHGQEAEDLRRLLDAAGRAAAARRARGRHDRQLAHLRRRHRHPREQGVHRGVRAQVQAAAVVVRRVRVHRPACGPRPRSTRSRATSRTAPRSSRRCARCR